MIAETIPQIASLDPSQKLLLASELWESVLASDLDIPASESLIAELKRRDEEFQQDPSLTTKWSEAKARIKASRD